MRKQQGGLVMEVVPLLGEEEIQRRVGELARDIAARLPQRFVLVALLKGSFMLAADLVRALGRLGMAPQVEFMQVSSYGLGTRSQGRVRVLGELPEAVRGRPVLLVDDIQDTGRTLAFVRELLYEHGAVRIWTCVLLDKPARRELPIAPDFVGFTIPDVFVVGYGIDYAERYRHLPYVARIA